MFFILSILLLPQVITFLLALIPGTLLLRYFYIRDPRPEPRRTVTKAFLWGIAATLPALIIEYFFSAFIPVGLNPMMLAAVRAFLVAGLVEESCKIAMVNKFIYPLPEFDEENDGIIYTMAAGLGFAFMENILYSMNSAHPWSMLLIRGVTSVPLHGLASGLMGYYIGKSKFSQKDSRGLGLLMAVLYHGLYDFFLFSNTALAWLVIPLLILLSYHAGSLMKKAVREDRKTYRV